MLRIYLREHHPCNTMEWTNKYCTVLNEMLCEAHERKTILSFSPIARTAPSKYPIGPQLEEPDDAVAARHTLLACRRGANGSYDITTEQTGLPTEKVYISTHTRQSQWYTKQSSENIMEWQIASFLLVIVLSTTQ